MFMPVCCFSKKRVFGVCEKNYFSYTKKGRFLPHREGL